MILWQHWVGSRIHHIYLKLKNRRYQYKRNRAWQVCFMSIFRERKQYVFMFVWTQVKHKIITFMSATEFKNILETKTHNEKEKKKRRTRLKMNKNTNRKRKRKKRQTILGNVYQHYCTSYARTTKIPQEKHTT